MSEASKKSEKKPEVKPARVLARSGESTDPAVHQLIAEIQTARLNGNAERVAELNGRLNDLGYE